MADGLAPNVETALESTRGTSPSPFSLFFRFHVHLVSGTCFMMISIADRVSDLGNTYGPICAGGTSITMAAGITGSIVAQDLGRLGFNID